MTQDARHSDPAWREHSPPGLLSVLGPLLSQRRDDQWIYGLRVRPEHLNPAQVVHGGTLATLMDHALSAIAWSHTQKTPCVTVQLNCNFLGPAALGDLLVADGHIVRETGSLLFMAGNITVNGTAVATAQGILKRLANPN